MNCLITSRELPDHFKRTGTSPCRNSLLLTPKIPSFYGFEVVFRHKNSVFRERKFRTFCCFRSENHAFYTISDLLFTRFTSKYHINSGYIYRKLSIYDIFIAKHSARETIVFISFCSIYGYKNLSSTFMPFSVQFPRIKRLIIVWKISCMGYFSYMRVFITLSITASIKFRTMS